MPTRSLLTLAAAAALGALAWRAGGWQGVLLLASSAVLWLLLQYTRLITVMQRAAHRPVAYVDSAVMLNARLKAGMPLLHVIALARALGERLSPEGAEPETYRWRDPGGVSVTARFTRGRLQAWQLQRPPENHAMPAPEQQAPN